MQPKSSPSCGVTPALCRSPCHFTGEQPEMTTVYIGLAAFAYAAFVVVMLNLFRCTDRDDE